ncbi:hypothetical protein MVEN_01297000 [Mycena venus]|uniref:Uncharacterized protein n=1 Tax=Mycena venus TaxID=2733690 RepID=A0A8H7CTM6_9AGAR|nr:hypothetical protein MVEN_01297000 [Mycena venus]
MLCRPARIRPAFTPPCPMPLGSPLPAVAVTTKSATPLFASLESRPPTPSPAPAPVLRYDATPTLLCRSSDDATVVLPMLLIRTIELIDANILTSRMHLLTLVPTIPLRPPRPHQPLARPMATTISPLHTGLPASIQRAGCLRHDSRFPLKPDLLMSRKADTTRSEGSRSKPFLLERAVQYLLDSDANSD